MTVERNDEAVVAEIPIRGVEDAVAVAGPEVTDPAPSEAAGEEAELVVVIGFEPPLAPGTVPVYVALNDDWMARILLGIGAML